MHPLVRRYVAAGACSAFGFLSISGSTFAQSVNPNAFPSQAFRDGLAAVFQRGEYSPRRPNESEWLDGGARYTALEPAMGQGAKGLDLVAYVTETGARSVLVPASKLVPPTANVPLNVEGYQWSADKSKLLIFTNSKKVWRQNTRGDYWVLSIADGRLRKLGGSAREATLMFAKFSPDGKSVGYVRENNIYTEDVATGTIHQVTTDGSYEIINGTSDWVNEEELDIRDAFRWSPDSQSIAYWQFDQSGVQEYTLINDTAGALPTTFKYKYPTPGTTNAAVRVGVAPAVGGATVWMKLPDDPRSNYVPRIDYVSDTGELAVEYLNRLQNDDRLFLANPKTGDLKLLVEEKDAMYVDVTESRGRAQNFTWVADPKSGSKQKDNLLWMSERDGWMQAYLVPRAGGQPKLITNFAADVIDPLGVDEDGGYLYFEASPNSAVQRYLYRAKLDGNGKPEQVTPANETGVHTFEPSPDAKYALEIYSSAMKAPVFNVIRMTDGKVLRVQEANADLVGKAKTIQAPIELTQTAIGGGLKLSTMVITPPNFDPKKKYPVLTYVYGEPASATVQDRFGVDHFFFFSLLAREGYVVLSFDNQGTPEPKGREWRKAGYGSIGVQATQQQAEAIRAFAKAHSYVDTSRMAIWGWSGGGTNTLNMMFRNPGLYGTGIAVAPGADQERYDSIYQERYMGLPDQNAKGYHDGSAVNFAEGLAGNLLIVHGSGDDNVHFSTTEILVNRLIALNKTFDFMDYPGRTHAISEGQGTTIHLYTLLARYLETHVPAGAR